MKRIAAGVLEVTYLESGPPGGTPVILLHGFPYDVHAYDAVAERLASAGRRVLVPYLRGYGPTRFRSAHTPRSGQQAALGMDLLAFMDALEIGSAVLAGYDWGGRAACIVSALWPERVLGLVSSGSGYNIQDIANAGRPLAPEQESRFWYQYYFHSERGRAGLAANRRALCRLLWRLWSPPWHFDDATFDRTAAAFDNPDFVDVVIHSYRHRFGNVPGDPACEAIETRLAAQPDVTVPSIVLQGENDGVDPPEAVDNDAPHFKGPYEKRSIPRAGHNLPQEAPAIYADVVLELSGAPI
jgi:pimeloyl-ACP methyl ester carboxylesterase